ncbi:T9SS type A sorting domain-containing protein [Crocinitomicaceae bacterium]|nr:T9SS type A sorting domain-containing protein [Crocinitomicaceae bacterium]
MKNYSLVIGLFLAHFGFSHNGNIDNGSFENWNHQDLFDYPTNWNTSDHFQFNDNATITKSTDAQDGLYSSEIGVIETDDDTIIGGIFHGEFVDAGIPYSDDFDEIRFQYKSDLPAGDTLSIFIIRYENGNSYEEIKQAIVGTRTNWTEGSVNFSQTTQDSLFVGFLMQNPSENSLPDPSAWVKIDAIEMYNNGTVVTNIPNASFEDWSTQQTEQPESWYTTNPILAGHGNENVIKTTDANTGTYAIELSTITDSLFGDTIPAILSMAPIDLFAVEIFSKVPYNASPSSFSGAYKYVSNNSNNDAGIEIEFFESGVSIGYHTEFFNETDTWQTFNSSLTISGQPDSILFVAYSGDNPGSTLKLDDLAFSGGNVSLDEFEAMNVSMFPNPATSSVMIKADGTYSCEIIDLTGHILKSHEHLNEAIKLDISDLNAGSYFVRITNGTSSVETLKLIIE